MESWHSTKINNYLALNTIIESNGWCVELFPVEVGAREYCALSLFYAVLKNWVSITLLSETPLKH